MRLAADLPDERRGALLAETLRVLRLPELAPLFGPGSRAEQPLCGRIDGQPFPGQVDRLAVTPDSVWILDYKTSRQPPPSPEATPVAYLRQMAAYAELLGRAFPDRETRAALLWTQGPRLDRLPAALLAPHRPAALSEPPAP